MTRAAQDVVICEGVSGTWFFHLARAGAQTRSLCGKPVMSASVPMWGCQPGNDRITYRWCKVCEAEGGLNVRPEPTLALRLGLMAERLVTAPLRKGFFSRERVDEIVLLLREAEKRVLD